MFYHIFQIDSSHYSSERSFFFRFDVSQGSLPRVRTDLPSRPCQHQETPQQITGRKLRGINIHAATSGFEKAYSLELLFFFPRDKNFCVRSLFGVAITPRVWVAQDFVWAPMTSYSFKPLSLQHILLVLLLLLLLLLLLPQRQIKTAFEYTE